MPVIQYFRERVPEAQASNLIVYQRHSTSIQFYLTTTIHNRIEAKISADVALHCFHQSACSRDRLKHAHVVRVRATSVSCGSLDWIPLAYAREDSRSNLTASVSVDSDIYPTYSVSVVDLLVY